MFRLLLLEMKKMRKSTYFTIMLLVVALFVSCYFVYNYIETERVDDLVAKDETIRLNFKSTFNDYKTSIESGEIDANDKAAKSDMDFLAKKIQEQEIMITAAKNHDWNTLLDFDIAYGEDYVKTMPSQEEEQVYTWPTHFTEEVHYKRNLWLKKNYIRPIFPISSELTAYDEDFKSGLEKEIAYELNNKHSSSAVYFLYLLFELALGIFGAGFFLFLFGDIVTKEGLGQEGSVHFLYTQPLKRGYMLVSKYLTVIVMTLMILAGVTVFALLLGTVFDRFGAYNYPVLIYEPNFSFHFMPMGTFIMLSVLLFFMVLLFCYACLFFFSVLTRRTSLSIGLTLALVFLGVKVSEQGIHTGLAAYNPFRYFRISDIITMEAAFKAENYHFTLMNGALSLGITSLVILTMVSIVSKIRTP